MKKKASKREVRGNILDDILKRAFERGDWRNFLKYAKTKISHSRKVYIEESSEDMKEIYAKLKSLPILKAEQNRKKRMEEYNGQPAKCK